jgi:hypothetical protein
VLAGILEIIVQRREHQFLIALSGSRPRHTAKPNGTPFFIFKAPFAPALYIQKKRREHEEHPSAVALHYFNRRRTSRSEMCAGILKTVAHRALSRRA